MILAPNREYTLYFRVQDENKSPADADELPTAELRLDGQASGVSVVVANEKTGRYTVTFTTEDWGAGQTWAVFVEMEVNGNPVECHLQGTIDATIDSRAPADTALSTAEWTNERAALLDNLTGIALVTTGLATMLEPGDEEGDFRFTEDALSNAPTPESDGSVFEGITSLAHWLRLLARNDAADATALAELNDGGGDFDPAANSLQALTPTLSGSGGENHLGVVYGSADQSVEVRFLDAATGAPVTVTSASDGLELWYRREGGAVVAFSAVDLADLTDDHTDGGLLLIRDGIHRVDVPDAAFLVGADAVLIGGSATGVVCVPARIALVTALEQVIIQPGVTAQASRVTGIHQPILYVGETHSLTWPAVVDANGDPVDLSAINTKQLIVATAEERVLKTYANAEITASGANLNIPVTDVDPKITAYRGKIRWSLRNTVGNQVIVEGEGEVRYAP